MFEHCPQLNSSHKKTKAIHNFSHSCGVNRWPWASKNIFFVHTCLILRKQTRRKSDLYRHKPLYLCVFACVCVWVCVLQPVFTFPAFKALNAHRYRRSQIHSYAVWKKKSRVDMDQLEEQFETHGWLLILKSLLILQVFLSESAFFRFTGLPWDTLSVSCLYFLFISGNDSAHSRRQTQEMYLFSFWYGVSRGTEPRREGDREECRGRR